MKKREIVEFKSVPKCKPETENRTNKLRLATEIKLDKMKISLYHGADIEFMNDVWELMKKYAGQLSCLLSMCILFVVTLIYVKKSIYWQS